MLSMNFPDSLRIYQSHRFSVKKICSSVIESASTACNIVSCFLFPKNNDWFKEQLLGQLADYDGPEADDETSKGWNKLFINVSNLLYHVMECIVVQQELSVLVTSVFFVLSILSPPSWI